MLFKMTTAVGTVVFGGAAVFLASTNFIPHERAMPIMTILLSAWLFCAAYLTLCRYQRPLGQAYELGYEAGRKDAIREATKRVSAAENRPVPDGMSNFNLAAARRRSSTRHAATRQKIGV